PSERDSTAGAGIQVVVAALWRPAKCQALVGLALPSILQIVGLVVTMASIGRRGVFLDHRTRIVSGGLGVLPCRAFEPQFWFDPCAFGRADPVNRTHSP